MFTLAECLVWTDLDEACTEKSHDDSDTVDGQLELEELGNAVVDVTTPHDGFHYRREVVIGQNNVRRLLGYIRPSNALHSTADDACHNENIQQYCTWIALPRLVHSEDTDEHQLVFECYLQYFPYDNNNNNNFQWD